MNQQAFHPIMDSIYRLCFPYSRSESDTASLVNLHVTDDADSERFSLAIRNGVCANIEYVATSTGDPVSERLSFVSNESDQYPLLFSVPPKFNKLKLELDVSSIAAAGPQRESSLLIVKSFGKDNDVDSIRSFLESSSLESQSRHVSRISFDKLVPVDALHTIIVNDAYNSKKLTNKVLNTTVWLQNAESTEFLFSFQIHISKSDHLQSQVSTPTIKQDLAFNSPQKKESITSISSAEILKNFALNLHDGPDFRKSLSVYEQDTPRLKKAILSLQDEVRNLDVLFKRTLSSRNKIIETLKSLIDTQFNSLIERMEVIDKFSAKFKILFVNLEKNLTFITREVLNPQMLSKLYNYCLPFAALDNSFEAASGKKTFERQSKEFYDWLHKYLSNEKDRPELKLLLKRKTFELSKFDYLNALNLTTNNQFFNGLLENLMKFGNVSIQDGLLDFQTFKDSTKSQALLSGDAQTYLNALSRFNSEKLQFRQMIEACRTNEELTTLLKTSSLSSKPVSDAGKQSDPSTSLTTSLLSIGYDQNPNISGILYARGGQGKPGWHKEWVVLKKGQLFEFSDWRNGTQPINKPIDIALASVKPITKDKRQFCLEIITSQGQKHVFQAINDDERNQWIKALYNAGQMTDRLIKNVQKPKLITDITPSQLFTEGEDRSSPVSIFSNNVHDKDDDNLKLVRSIPHSDNVICADCSDSEGVEWISMTFLVVVCVNCSSCHRNMGSHISKVKSLKLDNFAEESRVLLRYINNRSANAYLEENVTDKITPSVSDADRLHYIKHKYEFRTFLKPILNLNSLLVKAVRKIDIRDVVKLLNCGAEANIILQMSNPQWPEPLSVTLFEYSLRKKVEVKDGGKEQEFFVISELLLLHGCSIENTNVLHSEIVNDDEAIAYWMRKKARSMIE